MTTWILILLVHTGALSINNNTSIISIPKFVSEQECNQAGKQAQELVKETIKSLNFVCVKHNSRL